MVFMDTLDFFFRFFIVWSKHRCHLFVEGVSLEVGLPNSDTTNLFDYNFLLLE